ncbi:MAG: hypothetical protein CL414_02675 [Acidimicrobiaceae bacterium]|nr:hypothetical protein [Acidimicrobiaceae bacterium]|tara:strand:+ start:13651 stop:15252 length:1602 start_codon:yes stop_codon:yes gene_type:complete
MSTPGYGQNGSLIGPEVSVTASSASGVFTLAELTEAMRDDAWPMPFQGFIATLDPNHPSSTASYTTANVDLDSNGDLLLNFYTIGNSTGAYYQGGFAKINTSAKTLTDNKLYRVGNENNQTVMCNITVDSAGSDDIYMSGYTDASGTSGIWTTKLNSSYVEQWFGIDSSENLFRRGASSQASYCHTPASHRLSPDGTYLYGGGYGLNTGYDACFVPINTSTGYRIGANNITDYSNPPGMGFYARASGLNNSNFAYVGFPYHLSYGGYHNTVFKVWNGGSTASGVGLRIDFNGGSYSGGSYMSNGSMGKLYNQVSNADRYPFMGALTGGTGSGTAYFFRWNHATGWNTFDQGYRLAVNAADSPATPTALTYVDGITFTANDSTCYALMRDDGNTPSQNYLVSFDPDTSSTTINWQRKILIYRTADGTSVQNTCYLTEPKLDSAEQFLYFAGNITTNNVDRSEMMVFKLPVDGSGEGTYTVGDYTVVYEASTMTGTQGDLVGSTTGTTMTTFYPNESGTGARTNTDQSGATLVTG